MLVAIIFVITQGNLIEYLDSYLKEY